MHANGTSDVLRSNPILSTAPRRVLFFGKNMKRTRCTGAPARRRSVKQKPTASS